MPGYHHTQKAPWCFLLYGICPAFFAVSWLLRDEPVIPIVLSIAGVMMLLLGASFHHLTMADEGDRLAVRFGPLPLFRKRIRYADIRSVEVGRTLLLDGWGVHYSVRGGWVWNIWGRRCVVIRHGTTTRGGRTTPRTSPGSSGVR